MGAHSQIVDSLVGVFKQLYGAENVVPGSRVEREEALKAASVIEDTLGATARVRRFPVLSWSLRELSIAPRAEHISTSPYVESSSIEGHWLKLEGDPSCEETWRGFPEGRIAVVKEPKNPDDLKLAAINAARAGALGLIVESRSAPRVIVVNAYRGFSYSSGSPVDIPVVVVEEGYSSKLGDSKAVVSVDARVSESESVIIEAEVGGGGGDSVVIVGAHLDRWFRGALDNVLGIAQAIVAAKTLSEKGHAVRLTVFSSEEFGAPGYASWYWAWGSRFYAEQARASGLLDGIKLYLNFDTAGFKSLLVSGSPQYTGMSSLSQRCCETPETDSFSFAAIGVPTVSIHSMWSAEFKEIYHTPRDDASAVDFNLASLAVHEAVRLAASEPDYSHLEHVVLSTLGRGPLEARRAAYVLVSLASRVGWSTLYPVLAERFLKPVLYDYGCKKETDLEVEWFPEVSSYLRIIQDTRTGGEPPIEVWVAGDERLLYRTRSIAGRSVGIQRVAEQLRANVRRLWAGVEEIQRELVR